MSIAALLAGARPAAAAEEGKLPLSASFSLPAADARVGGPVGVCFSVRNLSETEYCSLGINRSKPMHFIFRARAGETVAEPWPSPGVLHSRYTPVTLPPRGVLDLTVWVNEFLRFEKPGSYELECTVSVKGSTGEDRRTVHRHRLRKLDVRALLQLEVLPRDEDATGRRLASLFAQAMEGDDRAEALDATRAIASVPGEATSGMLERIVLGRRRLAPKAAWLLAERGDDGARRLARLAEARGVMARSMAILALRVSKSQLAEGFLVEMLGGDDPKVRRQALDSLDQLNEYLPVSAATREKMSEARSDPKWSTEEKARLERRRQATEKMVRNIERDIEEDPDSEMAKRLRRVLRTMKARLREEAERASEAAPDEPEGGASSGEK